MKAEKQELSTLLKTFRIVESIGNLLILSTKEKDEDKRKKGLFDPKAGKFQIPPIYWNISRLFDDEDEDLYDVSTGKVEGIFSIKTQQFVLPLKYERRWCIAGPFHLVRTSGKPLYGVFNIETGRMFINPQFNDLDHWTGDLYLAQIGRRKGILDIKTGKLVTKIEFTYIGEINAPYYLCQSGGRSRIFNRETRKFVTGWFKGGHKNLEDIGYRLYKVSLGHKEMLFHTRTGNLYVKR